MGEHRLCKAGVAGSSPAVSIRAALAAFAGAACLSAGVWRPRIAVPRQRDKIAVFDPSGTMLREWGKFGSGDGEFDLPGGIVIQGDRVYVADQCNRRIQVFDRQGTFLSKWGSKGFEVGQFGGNPHPKAFFAGPTFLACDQQGNIFTTEAPLCRIQKFSSEGVPLRRLGKHRTGARQVRRLLHRF